ncbi:shikimate dehydrogenase family protein [Roseibium aggregatum]|uniref:shikimate dehydrogenase (NADP(+)) n=1 Tax=Roseibium aggregatum TaxID=187304 RepID=A0A926NY23_9HYPH|nr:NAD(P)-binding domain-containing protein [Roseibium aggregatum]MBD1545368.1 NAD(P)-binding domain-containing protein [Roseibium aggregatum]
MRKADTLRGGLIGAHISRTRLPAALSLLCIDAGLALEFELIDSAEDVDFDLSACLAACRDKGWNGVSVTHPHKIGAFEWLDGNQTDEVAKLGSVNMIVFGPTTFGTNTDYTGFLSAWQAEMGSIAPGRVALAGAGGVGRALGHALARLGATEIVIFDAAPERANELAKSIGPTARSCSLVEIPDIIRDFDGLVNATPIGTAEYPGSAFPSPIPGGPTWVFDAIYTPTETQFIQDGRAAGAEIITGFSLFKHMALRTFEAYTGRTPDAEQMLPQLDDLKPGLEFKS